MRKQSKSLIGLPMVMFVVLLFNTFHRLSKDILNLPADTITQTATLQ